MAAASTCQLLKEYLLVNFSFLQGHFPRLLPDSYNNNLRLSSPAPLSVVIEGIKERLFLKWKLFY